MGVRGLTTYIENNSHLYLSKYQLHNCTLVIDGNNLASQLYAWVSKSNSAFGGDYNRYYKCIHNFFSLLIQCKVTPLVVFDGGYETRKLGTVWLRLQNKFFACRKVTPNNQMRRSVFPLLMKDVFRDVLIELGISFAQCDFEADEEIATLARELHCPLLSYDSDFYVYDVLYIPFNSFELKASEAKSKSGLTYSYVNCNIYKVERFLCSFGGLQKEMLPLMATLLGNDYIKRSLFDGFFAQIRMPNRKKSWTEQHRRIAGLLEWLRKESVTSAIPKILSYLKQRDRANVSKQMNRAIAAYALTNSSVRKYLVIPDSADSEAVEMECDAGSHDAEEGLESLNIAEEGSDGDEKVSENASNSDDVESEGEDDTPASENMSELIVADGEDETPRGLPASFLERYRQGLLPACFMDLLTKGRFYILQPQKENYTENESSHMVSVPLLRHLVTLLLGPENAARVKIITRKHTTPVHVPLFKGDIQPVTTLPSLDVLPTLKEEERLLLLMEPTLVTHSLVCFPEDWRLYFLAMAYWANNSKNPSVSDKHVHAVILGAILLSLIEPFKKGGKDNAPKLSESTEMLNHGGTDIKSTLKNVKCFEYSHLYSTIFVPHSHAESKNYKNVYDASVVHSFAQFQSVLFVMTQLNQLLGMPLKPAPLHQLFSGTLLYNLYRALHPRNDVEAYISTCLSKSPSILALHRTLTSTVLQHLAPSTPRALSNRRPKNKRKRKRSELSDDSNKEIESHKRKEEESNSDDELVDPNNRFALLATM